MDTRAKLIKFGRQKPFKPFRIKLADGRSFSMIRPHMFGLGLTKVSVCSETALLAQVPLSDVVSVEEFEAVS